MPVATPVAEPAASDARLAFTPSPAESGAVSLLAGALLGLFAFSSVEGSDPTPGRSPVCRLDVNEANRSEWQLMRGVGPKLAERIVEDRTIRGPFVAAPDLLAVKGVGPKLYERLRPHLRFPTAATPVEPLPPTPAERPIGAAVAAR
ncbi:MAG: helix-hairpin-helix domain-containing protein [Planctomycetota bacterium]